jgi:hypothetical protein
MRKLTAKRFGPIVACVALSLSATAPAWPQGTDPIGELRKSSTYDRARHVDVATVRGKAVCYFREEGSSHRLDIGIGAMGAFIRVESGDGPLEPGAIPQPPLKVFAGKELTKVVDGDVKSTGEYQAFQVYEGAVEYLPNLRTRFSGGFAVIAKADAVSFLGMVARARREFVVVQSKAEATNVDVIAIYNFDAVTVAALLACARQHVRP